ncbi:PAS domain S-box protein [Scytonema sp. NUACC21]
MDLDTFSRRAQGMHRRLTNLYEHLNTVPVIPEVLPQALIELGSASEIVNMATQELYQQNEELITTRDLLEKERKRYKDLFEFAPDAYFVTDTLGIIQEANSTAFKLLNVPQQNLVGKPLINYVTLQDRQTFRSFLIHLCQHHKITDLTVRWQKRNGESFDGASTAGVVYNQQGKAIALRWLLRDITERKVTESASVNNDCDLSDGRLLQKYCKGEVVPLSQNTIWYVHCGLVKLSTVCETGEEVLVGLVSAGMVFGSSLTTLPTYQATALSDVSLVSISLGEIAASPMLNQILIPKINQRLRQTESFLAIAGRRRVEDRFFCLLQLLKKEIGQPVAEGTRLLARLTHEDLASACCTTRVTITRLMGKLQKQGKIGFDSKNHIILKEID